MADVKLAKLGGPDLELWGGHECTVNRVGDRFFDQTRRTGHQDRPEDLERFAGLGLTALRYPVLWERVAPNAPDELDWTWSDDRLRRMERLGLRPILGLVHHGSGPRYTGLLEDNFASGLAAYAGAVARRYPHVRDWTPINEPLTTARFSALYGHWYPHLRDESAFWLALLNQVDGVRLAMAEIRKVNPAARLIQTEDLGRTYATAPVSRQADFDNDRRWATWDLLAGRLTKGHPLWERLAHMGFRDRLARLADAPCPADVLGVNHYLTSDRFLDHRWADYPADRRGGNDLGTFADVEAIRVLTPAPGGLEGALQEAWGRYGRRLAVTECQLGCTREDQMRWICEAWETACGLRQRGVEIEAVTAWALLGSFDWNSLLTRDVGHYECGAFDVRAPQPRATGLARMLSGLTRPAPSLPPAAAGEGWWRRDVRLAHRPVFRSVQAPQPRAAWRGPPEGAAPLLITGGQGVLASAFARSCEWRGLAYVLTDRSLLSLDDGETIDAAMRRYKPWAVINAAGWSDVETAEAHADACFDANVLGAERLAEACATAGLPLVSFSSDLVFDGAARTAYTEMDRPNPLNVFGRSKLEAERRIVSQGGSPLIIRSPAMFSPYDGRNFAARALRAMEAGEMVQAPADLVASQAYVPDLVDATLDLLIDGETGLWHLANSGPLSWAAFGCMIANAVGHDVGRVSARSWQDPAWRDRGWIAERPAYCGLTSAKARVMPSLSDAVDRYAATLRAAGALLDNDIVIEPSLDRISAGDTSSPADI